MLDKLKLPMLPTSPQAAGGPQQKLARILSEKTKGQPPIRASVIPASEDPSQWCFDRARAAEKDKPRLLRTLLEDLAAAELRLRSADRKTRTDALGMVSEIALTASEKLRDQDLAVGVVEAVLLPNLASADPDPIQANSRDQLLQWSALVYREAKLPEREATAYKLCVECAHNRNRADGSRHQLAAVLVQLKRFGEAAEVLRGIEETGAMAGSRELIPGLEKKAAEKPEKPKK